MTQSRYIELKSKTIGELSQDSTVSESDIRFIIENLKKDISDIEFDKEDTATDSQIHYFYEGRYHDGWKVVEDNLKYNYANENGKLLSEVWFSEAYPFWLGVAKVCNDNQQWNLIKTDGTYLSDEWFDRIRYRYRGYKDCWLIGSNRTYDESGNCKEHVFSFPEDKEEANNGGWKADRYYAHNYYYNDKGEKLQGDYEIWTDFSHGIALVRRHVGGSGEFEFNYLKTDGTFLFDEWYDSIDFKTHGWFCVRRRSDMRYNFINEKKELLFPNKWYKYAMPFANYMATISDDSANNTYIDADGRILYTSPKLI